MLTFVAALVLFLASFMRPWLSAALVVSCGRVFAGLFGGGRRARAELLRSVPDATWEAFSLQHR